MTRLVPRFLLPLLGAIVVGAGTALTVREQTAGSGRWPEGEPDAALRDVAFIANAVDGTVTLLDAATAEPLGTLDILPEGRRVSPFRDFMQGAFGQHAIEASGGLNYAQDTDLSADGRVLFVSRGHLADVAAFDIATGALIWRTPVRGVRADHMAITPDGSRLFVSALLAGVVEALDARTGRKLGAFPAGDFPHDLHVSGDGAIVYAASIGDMQRPVEERAGGIRITLADAGTLAVLEEHPFEKGVRPFQLAPGEGVVYAQLSNTHDVVAYEFGARRMLGARSLPVAPGVTEADWDFEAPHHGLALSTDGALLCAAGRASDYAAFLTAPGLDLLATTPVGDAPSWAAVTPDGASCVVANNRSDDVSFLSLATFGEWARVKTGRGPKHITLGAIPADVAEAAAAAARRTAE